jgi:hypothetical protein
MTYVALPFVQTEGGIAAVKRWNVPTNRQPIGALR